jgi:hypothetical protein
MEGFSLIYPAFAFTLLAVSFILVPRERYRIMLPIIILGLILHGAALFFFINVLAAFRFAAAEPFALLGIPVFISISWIPSFALFLWGLPEKLPRWTHYAYIAAFALIGVFIDMSFQSLGLQPASAWYRSWMWFFPLYPIYWVTYFTYLKRLALEPV